MLSIDETIAKYKEIASTDSICPGHCNISCDKCMQESKQIIEWLEELKDYRDKNKMVVRIDCANSEQFKDIAVKLAKEQYNMAIDECLSKLNFYKDEWDGIYHAIEEIEQLKAGGENEI